MDTNNLKKTESKEEKSEVETKPEAKQGDQNPSKDAETESGETPVDNGPESPEEEALNKQPLPKEESKVEAKAKEKPKGKNSNKIEALDKRILDKDEEIAKLKAKLAESQEVNKVKKGDIRSETNRQGDTKLIKIGKDEHGKSIWKKANELTDSDIERRKKFIEEIKQLNSKKY